MVAPTACNVYFVKQLRDVEDAVPYGGKPSP